MLRDREVRRPGFQMIVRSGSVQRKVTKAIKVGLEDVGELYLKAAKKNISLDDHTLEELRKLGHPYSVDGGAKPVHADDALVHEQSGKLKKSLKVTEVSESNRRWGVYLTSSVEYMKYLIFGTKTMRPRRFHEKSYKDIKDKVWKPLKEELGKIHYRIYQKQ